MLRNLPRILAPLVFFEEGALPHFGWRVEHGLVLFAWTFFAILCSQTLATWIAFLKFTLLFASEATGLFHQFFDFLLGCPQPQCAKQTLIAQFASRYRLNRHTFLWRNFCVRSGLSFQTDFVPWVQNLSKLFFVSALFAGEDDCGYVGSLIF